MKGELACKVNVVLLLGGCLHDTTISLKYFSSPNAQYARLWCTSSIGDLTNIL